MTTIERLLIVQERDRKIGQLSRESRDIPARKGQIEAHLDESKTELHAHQEELKKLSSSTKQIEGDVDALKEKIAKFREQQFQIKSNEEYKALENEIAGTQAKIGDLEDKELGILEQMDAVREEIKKEDEKVKVEEARVKEDLVALDKRLESIDAEIHDLQVDRNGLTEDIEPGWLSKYERIMKHVGDFAMVPVDNGTCGGCHMNLPTQLVHDAKKAMQLTFCTFCGRILYWRP